MPAHPAQGLLWGCSPQGLSVFNSWVLKILRWQDLHVACCLHSKLSQGISTFVILARYLGTISKILLFGQERRGYVIGLTTKGSD